MVWAGTNNHTHTAEQVAVGTKATMQLVNQQQPLAQVMVPGLLPRGQQPNPLHEKNPRVNELVGIGGLAGHGPAS